MCFCSAKTYEHVHCPCSDCNGKAVHRRTQLPHVAIENELEKSSSDDELDDGGVSQISSSFFAQGKSAFKLSSELSYLSDYYKYGF